MANRIEFVNASGLRADGRRPKEARRTRCALGVLERADGSAIFELGNTRVLACGENMRELSRWANACARPRLLLEVVGPAEARRSDASESGSASISCEFSTAAFATPERRVRRPGDRRSAEAAATIQQCFESVVLRHLYPRSEISIYIQVLQSDGGALCAAINAATLALLDAGIAVKDIPVACAVSYVQKTALLDPNHTELLGGGAEIVTCVLPRSGKLAVTVMDDRLPVDAFQSVMELAAAGCAHLSDIMTAAVKEHVQQQLITRGPTIQH